MHYTAIRSLLLILFRFIIGLPIQNVDWTRSLIIDSLYSFFIFIHEYNGPYDGNKISGL